MAFDKAKVISAAEKHLAQGKIPAAIQEYRRVVAADAHDFSALNTLGDLHARVNQKQEATECFTRVAGHYRDQGFALKAIAVYKKISRLTPDTPHIAEALAQLYEQQGLHVDARAQYATLAEAHARAGNTQKALAAMRRLADLDPQNVQIRTRIAEGYLREKMNDEAADAFTETGALLLARDDAERALQVYNAAYQLRPSSHVILHGIAAAHAALGEPDEVAAVLERAVAATPGDLELRAMLARAYIQAEDPSAAERTAQPLVTAEVANYPLLLEVSRLYLQRNEIAQAVRVLAPTVEPAMAGRQEQELLELLNDALARDPEQVEALRLLLRLYTWQRDDDRMRVTLERLAEAAQTHNLADEERRALEHLVRLMPFHENYRDRLQALGGDPAAARAAKPTEVDAEAIADATPTATPLPEDPALAVPEFERARADDYVGNEFIVTPSAPFVVTATVEDGGEFEWNTVSAPVVEPPAAVVPSAQVSWADLNDDVADSVAITGRTPIKNTSQADDDGADAHEEIHVSSQLFAPPPAGDATAEGSKALLTQELESVDFYLAQGYTDIARDTLDLLERQYGADTQIDERRQQLRSGEHAASPVTFDTSDLTEVAAEAGAQHHRHDGGEVAAQFGAVEFDSSDFDFGVMTVPGVGTVADAPPTVLEVPAEVFAAAPTPVPTPAAPVLNAELAALFDDLREAEDEAPAAPVEDYEMHYNLGHAYREMDMIDAALEEFQTAISAVSPRDGTARYLQCCNLLGHCFLQKGMLRPAIMWFKKGLETPGHTEDEYQALRYDLGSTYEQAGDSARALEVFSEIYALDVSYRGVAAKVRELQQQVGALTENK